MGPKHAATSNFSRGQREDSLSVGGGGMFPADTFYVLRRNVIGRHPETIEYNVYILRPSLLDEISLGISPSRGRST